MKGQRTLTLEDSISEICINLSVSREKAVDLAINFLNLVSKVPEYSIAFIDKEGNVVRPVDIEEL